MYERRPVVGLVDPYDGPGGRRWCGAQLFLMGGGGGEGITGAGTASAVLLIRPGTKGLVQAFPPSRRRRFNSRRSHSACLMRSASLRGATSPGTSGTLAGTREQLAGAGTGGTTSLGACSNMGFLNKACSYAFLTQRRVWARNRLRKSLRSRPQSSLESSTSNASRASRVRCT